MQLELHTLARLVIALIIQDEIEAERCIGLLRSSATPREKVREAILQTYLFDGYPTALEGMLKLNERWPGEVLPVEQGDFRVWEEWKSRGEALYQAIYGDVSNRLQENARSVSPELARWMIVEGYGKVLSRPGLTILEREQLIVAILLVKRRPRQLHSHLRGAIRVGASADQVTHLLQAIRDLLPSGSFDDALTLLERLIRH